MKKSTVVKTCCCIIVIAFIVILFAIILPKPGPAPIPIFDFLSGRTLIAKVETNQPTKREIQFLYSFEADFSNVVADANSELSILDFYNSSIDEETDISEIQRSLPGQKPTERIVVRLIKNQKMKINPTTKNPNNAPVQYIYEEKDGWVSVVIIQRQKKNWLICNFNKLLDKLRN